MKFAVQQLLKNLTLASVLIALAMATMPSETQTYSFPFKGEDLNTGERIHVAPPHGTGIQSMGYDMGAFRYSGSMQWSRLRNGGVQTVPKDHVIHGVYDGEQGLPFYAMAAGEVIGCWRNSPNDPSPAMVPKVIGGGNHIWIRQEDGRIALYAHAAAGSIPSEICPYDEVYTVADYVKQPTDPDIFPESLVPRGVDFTIATGTVLQDGVVLRPTVKEGQFLGRVGYTGFTGRTPHIHVHMETGGSPSLPALIKFHRGLTTPVTNDIAPNLKEADIDTWLPFPNDQIPNGEQFIWPARTLSKEYARHHIPAADYQRLFDHLSDSGFWPEWIDGYSVAGQPFLNFIWRPAENAWRSFFLISASKYQTESEAAKKEGFQPYQVESSLVNGEPRYSVIFRKGLSGNYIARHGLTVQEHDVVFEEATEAGLNPMNDSVVSVNGALYFTVLYRSDDIGNWQLKPIVAKKDYLDLKNDNSVRGRRPFYVQSYQHRNIVYYSVIFSSKPTGAWKDRHGMSKSEYQTEWGHALNMGLLTRAVSGTDNAPSTHEYIAVWRK